MRRLVWLAVGFAAACAFGAYFYNPWLLPIALLFLLLALLFHVLTKWKQSLRILCAVCLGVSMGLGIFNVYDRFVLRDARQMEGKTRQVTIEATDYSYETDRGSAFDGKVVLGKHTYKVRVYLNEKTDLTPGQQLQGDFRFQMTYDDKIDSMNYAGKGIFLFAYQSGDFTKLDCQRLNWAYYPALWRNELKTMIGKTFSDDTEGFARALLLGDTSGIDYETDTALKVSGIRHVIAVSGLHVSVVFGLIYLLAGKRRVVTALIGIPAMLLFAALVGFTPSVTRACIMQILMMLALLFNKEYDPPTALAFSVLIMLGTNPMSVASVSFQLSVGCLIGIFLFSGRIYNRMLRSNYFGKGSSKLSRWICGSISVTLGAMITTTPLSALYFGAVSLIGIFTNLLTLWVITIIFYGIILVCALGYIWLPAAQFIGRILGWLVRYVETAAKMMAAIPMSAVYTKSIYTVIFLVFAYVLLAIYLLLKRRSAKLFTGLLICGLLVSVALSWFEPLLGECRVTVLDVGQGQAILLQSRGKSFLVDCGGDYDKGAANVTAETLLSQGISKLDGIILTHYDGDHAGGVPYLLTRIEAENLFLPYAKDENGVGERLHSISDGTVHSVCEDIKISYDSVEITIFAPISYNSGNESSMCVLFQTKNCDILITGDRGVKTEQLLLSRYDLPKLELLVAGHHGSKNSTSTQLLEKTQPEYVVISVGEDNYYGHPAQETIDRLLRFGCKILRTDQCGTVIFRR